MIKIRGLTKSYKTTQGRRVLFKDMDVNLPSGRNIGILGKNGAGKSTFLRILGGIDYPDAGSIETNNTISWPMGLSGGFQGSMTGRENAAFVSQIHGVWGKERKELLRKVEEFAEIGEYFDMPVKTYSSGMRSKLAFGLSVAVDFDYYLVDEVLSVGDAQFRKKCNEIIAEKKKKSNFIIVAHSMATLRANCDMGIFLSGSGMEVYEDINDAIFRYENIGKSTASNVKPINV